MACPRALVVSNRLSVTASRVNGTVRLTPSTGGLATGLARWCGDVEAVRIGWLGTSAALDSDLHGALESELAHLRVVPVHLSHDVVERYYHGFANRVLWPLFHYLIDRIPIDASGWDAYRAAKIGRAHV